MPNELQSKQVTPYEPKAGEEYMSPGQLVHFRKILEDMKVELGQDIDRAEIGRASCRERV